MATLYSAQLLRQAGPDPWTVDLGPVPAGFIWVVRDIQLVNVLGYPQSVGGVVINDEEGSPVWSWQFPEAHGGCSIHWDGRQVMETGVTWQAITAGRGWNLTISGYALVAP